MEAEWERVGRYCDDKGAERLATSTQKAGHDQIDQQGYWNSSGNMSDFITEQPNSVSVVLPRCDDIKL